MKAWLTISCLRDTSEDATDNPTWWVADDEEMIVGNTEISEVLRLSPRPLIYSQGDLNGGTINLE